MATLTGAEGTGKGMAGSVPKNEEGVAGPEAFRHSQRSGVVLSFTHSLLIQWTLFTHYILTLCRLWGHKHEKSSGSALQQPVSKRGTTIGSDEGRSEIHKGVQDFSGCGSTK